MKYPIILFLLLSIFGCTKTNTVYKTVTISDTVNHIIISGDTAAMAENWVSVKKFGAYGDGIHDDTKAIQAACDACIQQPTLCSTVYLPIGSYIISSSILLQNNGHFFTMNLQGAVSNKSASDQYLSKITYLPKQGFALGIQLGRSIQIKNLSILGQYKFPYSVTNKNIGTLKFSDWVDPTITDTRYNPYVALSIDPNGNASGSQGGTSDVLIQYCAFKQFMVGAVLSPSGTTQNAEMISFLDDDIEATRVAIAICQDQSKEIHIDRFKCWASTHTIVDGVSYGRGTGGGSVMIDGMNIAGNVNELFNLNTDRFPLSVSNVYSESLFRIGNVGFGTGANFINTQIDFLTGTGMPAADYLISGQANFYGGMLRYYDNSQTHRLNLSNLGGDFRDMTINNQPITAGLYGGGPFPTPFFDNVSKYYSIRGGATTIVNTPDKLTSFRANVAVDKTNWTATVTATEALPPVAVGDYILGSPCSVCRAYYDPSINPYNAATIQIGRVTAINGSVLSLDDVGLNAATGFDAIYVDKVN